MQETVKLITSNEFRKNQVNSLPNVGDVKFDENGIVEIPEQHAQLLVDLIEDLSFFSEEEEEIKKADPIKPQTQEEDLTKSDDKDSLQPQVEENNISGSVEPVYVDGSEPKEEIGVVEKPTIEEITAALEAKSAKDLKEMVTQFDPNYIAKNRNEAITYLIAKLSA